jgi:predicted protein tyrosine phosphatase
LKLALGRCSTAENRDRFIFADAETPVSGDLIEWADVVLVMEKSHRNKLSKKYKELLKGKRLVCLDIPDHYERMQPELSKLLKAKVPRYVRLQ